MTPTIRRSVAALALVCSGLVVSVPTRAVRAENARTSVIRDPFRSTVASHTPGPYSIVTGIQYGTRTDQRLDILYPVRETPVGVVVWAHGGGWVSGSRKQVRTQAVPRWLLDQGWAVATFDYRLTDMTGQRAEVNPYPAAVADAQTAVRWIRTHRVSRNLGKKLVIAGWSAGGNLAVMTSIVQPTSTGVGGGPVRVDGILSVAGITDVKAMYDVNFSFFSAVASAYVGCRHIVATLPSELDGACDVATLNSRFVVASAAAHARDAASRGQTLAPLYLIVGTRDPLVKPETQATTFARLWRRLSGKNLLAQTDVMATGGHSPRFGQFNAEKLSAWLNAIRDGSFLKSS